MIRSWPWNSRPAAPAGSTRTRANHACLPCRDAAGTALWLQNNAWGFEGDAPPQEVAVGPDGTGCEWRWNWPARGGADDERVIAYPGVICGQKPFGGLATSTARLPVPLDRVAELRVTHDLRLKADGGHNAAFDLWLTRGPQGGGNGDGEGVLAEVMVWLVNRYMHPAGTWVETVSTPHGPARLFDGPVRHWRCLTFVLEAPRPAGVTDLGFFLGVLGQTGRLPAAEPGETWLASVELGTEIYHGKGHARLRDFRVGLTTRPEVRPG